MLLIVSMFKNAQIFFKNSFFDFFSIFKSLVHISFSWSRIFSEGLLETNSEISSVIMNRNRFAGTLDPANRMPYVYSPVTGKKANGYSFMQRLWVKIQNRRNHKRSIHCRNTSKIPSQITKKMHICCIQHPAALFPMLYSN